MISSSQHSSSTGLRLSPPPTLLSPSPPTNHVTITRKVVLWRRKFYVSLLLSSIFLNGLLSPAMAGLISHILAVTHDQRPTYGDELKNGSAYFLAVTGMLGLVDACILFALALIDDARPLKWNWSGKEKHRDWKLPVHRLAALVSVLAVMRGAAAAGYANYAYWDSDDSIDQHLAENGTYYTPETWICRGAPQQTVIEGEHPQYESMCREATGARYLSILTTALSGITLLVVLWRWRHRNLGRLYQPVAHSRSHSEADILAATESGRASGLQEVQNTEVYELLAEPRHDALGHDAAARDSDVLSIQSEPSEYFASVAQDRRRSSVELTSIRL